MIQGGIRINTYIGLTFACALHGSQRVAVFALACAVTVPLVNIICVSILAVCGSKGNEDRPPLWREMATNPLILACAAGLLINVIGLPLPEAAAATLKILGTPALACGTLVAGAAITFKLSAKDAGCDPDHLNAQTRSPSPRSPSPRSPRHRSVARPLNGGVAGNGPKTPDP